MKIINSKTARDAEGTSQQKSKPKRRQPNPERTPTNNDYEGMTAREKTAAIAAEKYGIKSKSKIDGAPLTAAERRARRRLTHVAKTIEVKPEIAAKLKALAEAKGMTEVGVISDLIKRARIPQNRP